jgi:hypothetical protein
MKSDLKTLYLVCAESILALTCRQKGTIYRTVDMEGVETVKRAMCMKKVQTFCQPYHTQVMLKSTKSYDHVLISCNTCSTHLRNVCIVISLGPKRREMVQMYSHAHSHLACSSSSKQRKAYSRMNIESLVMLVPGSPSNPAASIETPTPSGEFCVCDYKYAQRK